MSINKMAFCYRDGVTLPHRGDTVTCADEHTLSAVAERVRHRSGVSCTMETRFVVSHVNDPVDNRVMLPPVVVHMENTFPVRVMGFWASRFKLVSRADERKLVEETEEAPFKSGNIVEFRSPTALSRLNHFDLWKDCGPHDILSKYRVQSICKEGNGWYMTMEHICGNPIKGSWGAHYFNLVKVEVPKEAEPKVDAQAAYNATVLVCHLDHLLDRQVEQAKKELDRPCSPKYPKAYLSGDLVGNPWNR
jgi:hypothetical protein